MIYLYAALIILLAISCLANRFLNTRQAVAFSLFVLLALWAAVDVLGPPKPKFGTVIQAPALEEMVIASAQFSPGTAIYVWARGEPPVAYTLPWDVKLAAELQAGLREAEKQGREGVKLQRGEKYGQWQTHPLPPQMDPPKQPGSQ